MGYMSKNELTTPLFAYSTLIVCALAAFLNPLFLALLALAAIAIGAYLSKKFGGLSGDMYGFVIESVELVLLCALVFLR